MLGANLKNSGINLQRNRCCTATYLNLTNYPSKTDKTRGATL